MTTIYLHGELAERFGAVWKLNVRSVGEAIRAIEANKPGIYAYLNESGDRGVDFNVKVNGEETPSITSPEDKQAIAPLSAKRRIETLHISPIVRGSKEKWVNVVIGIVLIVAAVTVPGMQGLAFGIKGLTWAAVVGGTGIGMAIGGVAQMIAGTPKVPSIVDQDGGTPSDLFSGPENNTTQGGPVPLIYGGPIVVGSLVVSSGIYTEDTGNGGPFYNVTEPYNGDGTDNGGANLP